MDSDRLMLGAFIRPRPTGVPQCRRWAPGSAGARPVQVPGPLRSRRTRRPRRARPGPAAGDAHRVPGTHRGSVPRPLPGGPGDFPP
ncbi:hypothetical protein B7R87_14675 [Streptomyces tsukubensis]|nr:hypothetical protein B7R87_14675 [Streptomyces tsukubensis]